MRRKQEESYDGLQVSNQVDTVFKAHELTKKEEKETQIINCMTILIVLIAMMKKSKTEKHLLKHIEIIPY